MHEEFEIESARPKAGTDELRETFPATAALVDQITEIFGERPKVLAFEENGRRVEAKDYRRVERCSFSLKPGQFLRLGQISRENAQWLERREKANGPGK